MRVLDLFSGIGGFSLGLERAGMETVAFCENDDFCRKVLAKHWPDVTIHKSIEELDGKKYRGSIELVCGGFPCQPYSVAGQQRGAEDDRALWPEMLRVIREVDPAFVLGENVSGIINMELGNCLSSLEDSGYAVQTFVIPACGVDAPHRRDRVWIIARKNDPGRGNKEERPAESFPVARANRSSEPDGSQHEGQRSGQLGGNPPSRPGNDEDVGDSESVRREGRREADGRTGKAHQQKQSRSEIRGKPSGSGEDVADSEGEFSEWSEPEGNRRGEPEISTRNRSSNRGRAKEDVADSGSEGLQGGKKTGDFESSGEEGEQLSTGFGGVSERDKSSAQSCLGGNLSDGFSRWMDEPVGTPRVIGACPDRVGRLKSLGNAVVPQVVEVLGKFIMEIHNNNGHSTEDGD